MPGGPMDRRTRRSQRVHEALSLQLDHVRGKARIAALVLATEEGLRVAHSGEEGLCEELAARAPFLSNERTTRVRHVSCLGLPLYLVSYGESDASQIDDWLEHASHGITRILAV